MANNKKQEAKDYIENRIATLLGADYIDTVGGKIYAFGKSKDGEKIQIAISLTCPSNPIKVPENSVEFSGFDWSDQPTLAAPTQEKLTGPSAEEMSNIANMLASLGL